MLSDQFDVSWRHNTFNYANSSREDIISLQRGSTYYFKIEASEKPFLISEANKQHW